MSVLTVCVLAITVISTTQVSADDDVKESVDKLQEGGQQVLEGLKGLGDHVADKVQEGVETVKDQINSGEKTQMSSIVVSLWMVAAAYFLKY